jgi:hypothetical protein
MYVCIHIYIHSRTTAYIHIYKCTYIHTYIHIYARTHARTHTHTHNYRRILRGAVSCGIINSFTASNDFSTSAFPISLLSSRDVSTERAFKQLIESNKTGVMPVVDRFFIAKLQSPSNPCPFIEDPAPCIPNPIVSNRKDLVDLISREMLFFHTQSHAAMSTMILVKAMLDYQMQYQQQQRLLQQRNTSSSPFMSPATPSSQSACTPPPQFDHVHAANMQYMNELDSMEMQHRYMSSHRPGMNVGMQEPLQHVPNPHQHYQGHQPQQRRQPQQAQQGNIWDVSGGAGISMPQQGSKWMDSGHVNTAACNSGRVEDDSQEIAHTHLGTGPGMQQVHSGMLSGSEMSASCSSSSSSIPSANSANSSMAMSQKASDNAASQLMAEARKQLECVEEREELGDLGEDDVSRFLRDDWNETQDVCSDFP